MSDTFLKVETNSLRIRTAGPATANICLVMGNAELPMHGWNDFVVVILGWWTAALLRLIQKISTREVVNFMDGPYSVEVISKAQPGVLQFRVLEGFGRNREMAIGEAEIKSFVTGLIIQSHQILVACRLQEWWSTDADTLQYLLVSLEKEAAQL